MQILKFGGTSMSDAKTWCRVLDIISKYKNPFVIVSATARTTRKLLTAGEKALSDLDQAKADAIKIKERHQKLITSFFNHYPDADPALAKECTSWIDKITNELNAHFSQIHQMQEFNPQMRDVVAAIGERLSSYLFARCGSLAGLSTTWIDAADIIRTDSDFGQASPDLDYINEKAAAVMSELDGNQIGVMGGYYGEDENGNTTTLGFEGSDYTASLMGAALSAEAIEIWTDVSGIFTCDPRLIPEAKPIPQLSFQEATELAYFGAKVLHPSTTKPASQKQITIRVKNIFKPDEPGTSISGKTISNGLVKAITFKENCAVITVTSSQTVMGYEFLAGVFDILRWHHLPVDVVTTTEASVSIAIENGTKIDTAVEQLNKYGFVDVLTDQGIISLVGCKKDDTQSLIHTVHTNTKHSIVNMISFSRSKGNLNVVMPKDHVTPTVKSIHKALFG